MIGINNYSSPSISSLSSIVRTEMDRLEESIFYFNMRNAERLRITSQLNEVNNDLVGLAKEFDRIQPELNKLDSYLIGTYPHISIKYEDRFRQIKPQIEESIKKLTPQYWGRLTVKGRIHALKKAITQLNILVPLCFDLIQEIPDWTSVQEIVDKLIFLLNRLKDQLNKGYCKLSRLDDLYH